MADRSPKSVVLGPLAAALQVKSRKFEDGTEDRWLERTRKGGSLDSANALIILRRCPINRSDEGVEFDDKPILRWALEYNLGHRLPSGSGGLMQAAARRRHRAVQMLAESPGLHWAQVRLTVPDASPVLVGSGEAGVRDIGIALHGTYGWPALPGSGLKGTTHSYLRNELGRPEPELEELFGSPRPHPRTGGKGDAAGEPAGDGTGDADSTEDPDQARTHNRGAVAFLDAVPDLDTGVAVSADVLTPHVREYYTGGSTGEPDTDSGDSQRKPPAEYWNPVPLPFLTVGSGGWVTHIVGTDAYAVRRAADALVEAVDDIGVGAKTAAGYGYLKAEIVDGTVTEPASGEEAQQ